ncbi:MAG TPA: aminotransferase class V-fold PLP-dependent enzyme [Bacteroidales bacterium]|nr:aminotransferase class V-fold PLP-dependent enzyme [Bacteroidales bacterium]
MIAQHEEELATLLVDFLNQRDGITIIGENSPDRSIRVPTISFTVANRKSSEIPLLVDRYKVGIRWGDFYARRLINDLNLSDNDGVIRISAVHYNTLAEIEYTIEVLDSIL